MRNRTPTTDIQLSHMNILSLHRGQENRSQQRSAKRIEEFEPSPDLKGNGRGQLHWDEDASGSGGEMRSPSEEEICRHRISPVSSGHGGQRRTGENRPRSAWRELPRRAVTVGACTHALARTPPGKAELPPRAPLLDPPWGSRIGPTRWVLVATGTLAPYGNGVEDPCSWPPYGVEGREGTDAPRSGSRGLGRSMWWKGESEVATG